KQANVSHETLACFTLRERRFSLPPIEHFGPWLETFYYIKRRVFLLSFRQKSSEKHCKKLLFALK
ncbi:hypothetical protein, partial [Enterococcus faecalis]